MSFPFRWAAGRGLGLAFRDDAVYKAAKKLVANLEPEKLLDAEEAWGVMRDFPGSKRPKLPLTRSWPVIPCCDLSVVVPCYNVAAYVGECLDSILGQSASRTFEVLAIDDGSSDDTGNILDAYACKDERVKVVHQENKGFSGARNKGLDLIRGWGIMLVDSDDKLAPGAIDTLHDRFTDCDYVTGSYSNMSADGRTITDIDCPRNHGGRQWGRLFSREVWRRLEFPEGHWFEDTVINICISPVFKEKNLGEPVYLYRENPKGITANAGRSKKGVDTLLVLECLLGWNEDLGVPFDEKMYARVVGQLGLLVWGRTAALDDYEMRCFFACACDLVGRLTAAGENFAYEGAMRPCDTSTALKTSNYRLWEISIV